MSLRNSLERFESLYIPEPNSGCWLWLGYCLNKGPNHYYGRFRWYNHDKGRSEKRLAHSVSYEIHKGPIPKGLILDHLCRNTYCVNPDHLEAVTQRVNMQRSKEATKTHCRHGHPYAAGMEVYQHPENTRRYRRCLTYYKMRYPATAKI